MSKIYTCRRGHLFAEEDSKEKILDAYICPECYPDGFLKDCSGVKAKLSELDAAKENVKIVEKNYEKKKSVFFKFPCFETRQVLANYMALLNTADKKVLSLAYQLL